MVLGLSTSSDNALYRFTGLLNLIPIVHQDFEDTTYMNIYIWQTVQSNTFQTTQNACM